MFSTVKRRCIQGHSETGHMNSTPSEFRTLIAQARSLTRLGGFTLDRRVSACTAEFVCLLLANNHGQLCAPRPLLIFPTLRNLR